MKTKKFKNAITGIIRRHISTTNPFLYTSLSNYIDVIFIKSKINLLLEFTIDNIRAESKYSPSINTKIIQADIEKYKPELFFSYDEYDNTIASIHDKMGKLLVDLELILNKKNNIIEQVERVKKLDIDIDEVDIKKYKPNDLSKYQELSISIVSIQNKFKLNNNILKLEKLSMNLENMLRDREIIIRNVERVKKLDINIDELDIKKYKPNDLCKYQELSTSIVSIQNEFKLNNNIPKLEKLSIDLENILRDREIIIRNVEKAKKNALKNKEKAEAIERKEIEEYRREKRNTSSSNTNRYGRIEKR